MSLIITNVVSAVVGFSIGFIIAFCTLEVSLKTDKEIVEHGCGSYTDQGEFKW